MARLIQITDPHILAPPGLMSGRLDTRALMDAAMDSILGNLARYAPVDGVLVTGDITDDGAPESYAWFRTSIERLNLPYFLIPGNHDQRAALRACFDDQGFMPDTGPINWVHDLPDLRIIGLDTLLPGQGSGLLDQPSLGFLADALHDRTQVPALIAMHHPPFATGIRFMDDLGLSGTAALRDILDRAPNECRIISGHVHATIMGAIGSTTAITCPSIASGFETDFRDDATVGFMSGPLGYMVHDWNGEFRSTAIPMTQAEGPFPF